MVRFLRRGCSILKKVSQNDGNGPMRDKNKDCPPKGSQILTNVEILFLVCEYVWGGGVGRGMEENQC